MILLEWSSMKYVLPLGLVLVSLVVTGYFVYMATSRTLTQLEGTLLQIFALLAGLTGSFWFGRQSAREAARDIIRPHARSAFRRLVSLYIIFSGVSKAIDTARDRDSIEEYRAAMAWIDGSLTAQMLMADDALEDWRDIAPEEVKELRDNRYRFAASRRLDSDGKERNQTNSGPSSESS